MQITDLIIREHRPPCLRHEMNHWKIFPVTGADARDFLNRMLSSNVPSDLEQSGLSACCTVDGRVQCVMLLFHYKEGIAYLAPSDTGEQTAAHLRRYILRSDVAVTASADRLIGLSGVGAEQWLRVHAGVVPEGDWHSVRLADGGVVIAVPGSPPRFFIAGDHSLPLDGLPVAPDESLWSLLDVGAAMPWLTAAAAGKHLPQMLNLHRYGAVDFNKGCYPGQEIIIRLQHRGKLKRRLYRLASSDLPNDMRPGDALLDAEGKEVGEIVLAGAHGTALAVVAEAAGQPPGSLRCKDHPVVATVVDDAPAQPS